MCDLGQVIQHLWASEVFFWEDQTPPKGDWDLISPDSSLVCEFVKLILAHLTAVKGRKYDFVKLKEQTLFGHWGLPYSTLTLVQN